MRPTSDSCSFEHQHKGCNALDFVWPSTKWSTFCFTFLFLLETHIHVLCGQHCHPAWFLSCLSYSSILAWISALWDDLLYTTFECGYDLSGCGPSVLQDSWLSTSFSIVYAPTIVCRSLKHSNLHMLVKFYRQQIIPCLTRFQNSLTLRGAFTSGT